VILKIYSSENYITIVDLKLKGDQITISFIENLVKGKGWERVHLGGPWSEEVWKFYKVINEGDNELWIVRPDGLKRAFVFKLGSIIEVGLQVVSFVKDDVKEELSVDEEEQSGKKPLSKLNLE
jgi:hypothetical protein